MSQTDPREVHQQGDGGVKHQQISETSWLSVVPGQLQPAGTPITATKFEFFEMQWSPPPGQGPSLLKFIWNWKADLS